MFKNVAKYNTSNKIHLSKITDFLKITLKSRIHKKATQLQ